MSELYGGIILPFECQMSIMTLVEKIGVRMTGAGAVAVCNNNLTLSLLAFLAQTTVLVMEHWIPLISDVAIIFKVIGFYPSQLYSSRSRILRLTPPIFLLLSRTALICYLTYISNVIYTQASSLSGQVKQVFSLDLLDIFVYIATTIFATQAAFCLYASCFLIYKICQFYFNLKQQHDGGGKAVIRKKSRLFVEITCMTFIPPFFLSILCAVFLYQSDNGPSKYRVSSV